MKIAPREQFILTLAAAALLIVVLVAVLVYPSVKNLSTLDAQISQAQSDVSSAKSLLAQRQAIKDRASQTDAKWLTLANEVPDNPDLPALIIELQDAAFESGVQLVAVTPGKPALLGTYANVPLNIQILGSWADSVDYAQRIFKLSRALRISVLSATVTNNSAQETRLNTPLPLYSPVTTFELEAYMIPAATTPTATAAPAPAGQ